MAGQIGRPPYSLTMDAIPEGPLPTARKKWATVAKLHAINREREKLGFKPIPDLEFRKWTKITVEELATAESHKEYVDASMSLAKGKAVMWFRDELENMQAAAKKLYTAGEDKQYLTTTMQMAEMLKFKDFTLDTMEEAEAKDSREIIEEILAVLNDEGVQSALKGSDGIVPQRIVPALVGASFKPRAKKQSLEVAQLGAEAKDGGAKGPTEPVVTVPETDDRPKE